METKPKITYSNNWRNTVKIKHTYNYGNNIRQN